MNKLAICVIAYNEDQNIASLLDKTLQEKLLNFKIFVYTDGSTDNTVRIVSLYKKKYPSLINHIQGKKRIGKNHAFNIILKKIQNYEVTIYMDADINFHNTSLSNLYNYLISNQNLNAVSPILLSYTKGLTGLEKTIAELYSKSRLYSATYKRYKYISPRMCCLRTKLLVSIPKKCYSEDFYLNLQILYETIDICTTSIVYYKRPTRPIDLIKYNFRLGTSLGNLKKYYNNLWLEQQRRVSVVDYGLFDLTRDKFGIFFSQLTLNEKLVFIFIRLLSFISMYFGILTYKPNSKIWNRMDSTKISYSQ